MNEPQLQIDRPYLEFPESEPSAAVRAKTLPPIPVALHLIDPTDVVLACVCESYHLELDLLLYGGKPKGLAEARVVAYWLMRGVAKMSWQKIGAAMKRDHTSAIAGNKTVLRRRQAEPRFLEFTDALAAAVRARIGGEP